MKRQIAVCLASLAIAGPVWAGGEGQHKKQPSQTEASVTQEENSGTGGSGQMDMSKMGPWTRKPTNEAQTKKEIEAFLKEEDKLMKSGDLEATLARVDFPIFMTTDNSKGEPYSQAWNRAEYAEMMKPFFEQTPADLKMKHNHKITVLSDSLALVLDDFTLTTGGTTQKGKNASLLVKRNGEWKWKGSAEAGWGDASQQGVGGSGEPQDELSPEELMEDGTGGSGEEQLPPEEKPKANPPDDKLYRK